MSSLQKFHRRTLVAGGGVVAGPFPTVGSGSDTIGYRLGYASDLSTYLIAAPKSTEVTRTWGSSGTVRSTTSTTDGALNTGTLYGFGSAAHPAAYYARALTTGGYNTWYLPAKDELNTCWSNHLATPFATANSFLTTSSYWSSTEYNGNSAWAQYFANGGQYHPAGNKGGGYIFPVRAVRLYNSPAAIGSGTNLTGYWLGTAGDGVSKLIVAPQSTETSLAWGSYGTVRGTTSTTNGVANTTTLFGFGSAAHPAAYYAKTLTTGGYNTWYLPAKNELLTFYSNKSATPFATNNTIQTTSPGFYYWSSTENDGSYANSVRMDIGIINPNYPKQIAKTVRAVRLSNI